LDTSVADVGGEAEAGVGALDDASAPREAGVELTGQRVNACRANPLRPKERTIVSSIAAPRARPRSLEAKPITRIAEVAIPVIEARTKRLFLEL